MKFAIACAVDDDKVFRERLQASPDWERVGARRIDGAKTAADVNEVLDHYATMPTLGPDVLVYAHQDVFLPEEWLETLERQWRRAEVLYETPVGVAGVYGVKTVTADRRIKNSRAGHLLDRGTILKEPSPLPHEVDSLDECVIAISVASSLRLDPALGWHFWATDLCLQAQERGMVAVAVDAYCEHWSTTSRSHALLPPGYAESREVFRAKWRHRLPIETPSERVEP